MKYISTRGGVKPIEFQDAVLMGLADDGGLVIPESVPDVRGKLAAWRGMDYRTLAFEVIRLFATDMPEADLRAMIDRTYADAFDPDVAVTVPVGPVHILELWHGPTLAFKDVALQLLGNLFEYILAQRGGCLNILGATSGDTGSAAIYGVRGRRGINIFIMHPHKRTSPIQERQMTSVLDANVHNMAIEGSFDDCQKIMKDLAGNLEFKRKHSLGAVNSVNWARVLAQIVYYFKTVFDVQKSTGAAAVQVSVPTGNFGDVLAGYYALRMGLPISRLILATNQNDICARFFNTGVYSQGTVAQTTSPSMDIQVASNFERYLFYKVGGDAAKLRGLMDEFSRTGSLRVAAGADGRVDALFASASASEDEVRHTIRLYYQKHNYVLDPHTAVGVCVAEKIGTMPIGASHSPASDPIVCLATAHPAKFPAAILDAIGKDPKEAHHPRIDALMHLPTRCEVLPNSNAAVRAFMEKAIG